MNKINKQNRNRLMDTENRLTAVKGEGVGGHGEKGKGIKHTQTTHRARQHIVTTREKEGWEDTIQPVKNEQTHESVSALLVSSVCSLDSTCE